MLRAILASSLGAALVRLVLTNPVFLCGMAHCVVCEVHDTGVLQCRAEQPSADESPLVNPSNVYPSRHDVPSKVWSVIDKPEQTLLIALGGLEQVLTTSSMSGAHLVP